MQYEFHPLAMDYRRMSAHDLGRMEEGMRDCGFDERFPIVLFDGKILDGCNRYLACQAAEVEPMFTAFEGTEEEARFFVQIANEERRHLTEEELSHKRQARIERVAEARRNGDSLRTIAATEQVSVVQVQRDLEESSGVPGGGTPEPPSGKVVGGDGKTYPAKKPETVFCRPCRTGTPKENCKDCKALRAPREPGDDTETEEASRKAEQAKRQQNGKPVFDDRTITELVGKLVRAIDGRAKAYGKTAAYRDMETKLEALSKSWNVWHQEKRR